MTQLPNYLRSNRKRLALSQDEVAFLLSVHGGAKVCRYEHFIREPSLKTALALEVIFQKPARELFAGLQQEVQRDVAARASTLIYKLDRGKPNPHRRQALLKIINSQSDNEHQS